MEKGTGVKGVDVPLEKLVPLHERQAGKKGYNKIRASIKALGLIEPLCVYEEGERYVILDGFLRYQACRELGIATVPCLILPTKEAYTCNRMVNHLSPLQESRMINQSLGTLDEDTIARALGTVSIRHRLKVGLVKKLHPDVVKAFDKKLLSLRLCADEFTHVQPEHQATILREMEKAGDYSTALARTLVLRTPEEMRILEGRRNTPWNRDTRQRKALTTKLEEAEQRHEFYTGLYRQYVADLLKLSIYVRRVITNKRLLGYMKAHHPDLLERFQEIIFETVGRK
jgi:hypothetical protein